MYQREYDAYKQAVDAADNRCCCCGEPVYKCPNWIASNPVEPDPPAADQPAPAPDPDVTADLDPPGPATAAAPGQSRRRRRPKSDT